jgi:hypothetical protein
MARNKKPGGSPQNLGDLIKSHLLLIFENNLIKYII